MPLDDLVNIIETLQQRIRDHGPTLRENETRTRMALIDPLLTALGWDVSDPSVVTPEYSVNGKRADYALLKGDGVVVFLEAKKLDEPLSNHRSQIVAYASELGIKFPALTNGNHWEVYDNSKLIPIDQRRILNYTLPKCCHTMRPATAIALAANLSSGQPMNANEPIQASERISEPAEYQQATNQVAGAQSGTWESLAKYDPVAHNQPPSAIHFENGSTHSVQFWYEVLAYAAEWLWSKEYLTHSNLPVASGPKRYIISAEPVHQSGSNFASPHSIGDLPLWISKHGNKQAMLKRTQALFQHCGIDPATVQLQVGQ